MRSTGAAGAALPLDLGHDRATHRDEAVHARRQRSEQVAVFGAAYAAGMDSATMYGRGSPCSPMRMAARVPTISARYMWLCTISCGVGERARRGGRHVLIRDPRPGPSR